MNFKEYKDEVLNENSNFKNKSKAYKKGFDYFKFGGRERTSPYTKDSADDNDWLKGYGDSQDEMAENWARNQYRMNK